MKVLIIGSKGMAGHVIYNFFKENTDFDVIDVARGSDFHVPKYQLDVTDFNRLHEVLVAEKPQVVINGIGILNKDAEDNPDKAILLNCYLPHLLARLGEEIGFKLIHISTDCVFNGLKGNYSEKSMKDGIGFYAQTKALGEVNSQKHLTLRTSIIGPELKPTGIGLFHWFMQQEGNIRGFSEAHWTGVTTIELAKAINIAIKRDLVGLHHLVNNSKINKFDLIHLFKTVFNKTNVFIESYDGYKVDKSLLKTDFSFEYTVPSYKIMIEEMKEWIKNHNDLYEYKF